MLRHVVDDLFQIGESLSGSDGWHEAVRVYVLLNEGNPLIFDTGSHLHAGRIMCRLKALLGDTTPKYVFLTHTELPHTGNLRAITHAWPDVQLVVSSGILPHVELPRWVAGDQVRFAYAGTAETYAGRQIAFLDGLLKDQPGTHWMFDGRTGTLFTADAFGYFFPADADPTFDDEIDGGVPQDWIGRYHASAFRFLPLVRGSKVTDDFSRLFEKRDIRVIAPTHGNAVRHDIARFVGKFRNALHEICQ